jgi:hypothetical protein
LGVEGSKPQPNFTQNNRQWAKQATIAEHRPIHLPAFDRSSSDVYPLVHPLSNILRLLICPGIHDPQLTRQFLDDLTGGERWIDRHLDCLVFPAWDYPAYSALHILHFLDRETTRDDDRAIAWIAFSAGVVGAIGAAWGWQALGGTVKGAIALDGWGVPLYGNFPIYRLSHDRFTHWSSALLGPGRASFYADPAVDHLQLWRSPATVAGYAVENDDCTAKQRRTTALDFLLEILLEF